MRPTVGLVSRAGSFGGYPGIAGALGPMARTVRDLALLLDVLVGYDPEDPITAFGVGQAPGSFAAALDTFLAYVPSLSAPIGFSADGLPAGMTFLGRPYSDATMIRLAYAYEQATHHRRPPATTPSLPGEP